MATVHDLCSRAQVAVVRLRAQPALVLSVPIAGRVSSANAVAMLEETLRGCATLTPAQRAITVEAALAMDSSDDTRTLIAVLEAAERALGIKPAWYPWAMAGVGFSLGLIAMYVRSNS